MKRLFKEPLVYFVVLGALLFIGYHLMNRNFEPQAGHIEVTQGQIESLRNSFTLAWQRPPTPTELDGLIQDYIREEVMTREAMALGLDRDDIVIRRRLRQKMEFVANDLNAAPAPSDAELNAFLTARPDLFRSEPRFSFRQVFLSRDQRGSAVQTDAARVLVSLQTGQTGGAHTDFQKLSDPTLLNPELVDVSAREVGREFGEDFAQHLAQAPDRQWYGPLQSPYGEHLVYVEDRQPGKMPALAEVRDRVAQEWADERNKERKEQFYQNLLKRYTVTIEQPSSAAAAKIATAEGR